MQKNNDKKSFDAMYQKLLDEYVARLKGDVAAMDKIMAEYQASVISGEALKLLTHYAHGLAGSGTTFGFHDVSAKGKEADGFLAKAGEQVSPESMEELKKKIGSLREACVSAMESHEQSIQVTVEKKDNGKTVVKRSDFCVMIVDDDENIGNMLRYKLKQKNINTVLAANGEEALKALAKEKPSLIVLDIMMPKVGGHETLQALKKNPDYASIPVMMLTSQTEKQDVVSALYSGAVDYVVKPVDPDQMVARIEKVLNATLYNILIVDNDQLMLQLTANRFREKGFNVRMMDDGKKAWDYILKHLPDIVILDRMMPGLEGFAVLSNMRSEKSTQNIPVIIVSARKEEKDLLEAKKRGANAYIGKPFILDDLIEQTARMLEGDVK